MFSHFFLCSLPPSRLSAFLPFSLHISQYISACLRNSIRGCALLFCRLFVLTVVVMVMRDGDGDDW